MAKKTKYRDEDLFKDSTMTFGEHLEELRAALFKSLLFTLLAFILVVSCGWATDAVNFIQIPLTDALERFYANYSLKRSEERLKALETAGVPVPSFDEIQDMVSYDRLVPHVYYGDPRLFVRTLQNAGFPLDSSFLPEVLAGDFLDPGRFCREVLEQRDNEQQPGLAIWERLKSEGRELIEQGAKNPDELAEDKDKRRQLAREIDERVLTAADFYEETQAYYKRLTDLRDRPWYDPNRWKDAALGQYTRQTLQADRLDRIIKALPSATAENRKALNRQLLALAYPESMPAGPRRANMMPFLLFPSITDDPRLSPKSLNVQEMFMVWIKAAIVLSLVIASPFVFYFIWSFVAAGLYPHEKSYVYLYLPFSLGLFLAGCALCFFYVLKYVLDFLFIFNDWMNVDPDMRISEWFGFALFLPLGFGIAFQLPLVMLFLERIGVMTVAGYLSKWRISVMVICVASAILTPADPYSMLLMAIPLVFLYFLGIGLCKYLPSRRNPFEEEAAA
jgi:sec-independent protein translocase protein TatC